MNEYITSLKAYLYDRTSSPLFGAFVASWCVWNFEFLLILWSDEIFYLKRQHIYDMFRIGTEPIYSLCRGFLYPLGTAIAFLIIYPWPAELAYWYSQRMQYRLVKRKKEKLLTEDESRDLILKLHQQEQEFADSITSKNEEIADLRSASKSMENELTELRINFHKKTEEMQSLTKDFNERYSLLESQFLIVSKERDQEKLKLTDALKANQELTNKITTYVRNENILQGDALQILKMISENESKLSRSDWLKKLPGERIRNEHLINLLINHKMVAELVLSSGSRLRVTPEGIAALAQHMERNQPTHS